MDKITEETLDKIIYYSKTLPKIEFVKVLNSLTDEEKEYVIKNMTSPTNGKEYNNKMMENK
jgi:hypothetical protein